MRSIEFFTYLVPTDAGDGEVRLSSRKLTPWQAIAWPGAMRVENSREVRQCPESAEEREELGFNAPLAKEPPKRRGRSPRAGASAATGFSSR